MRDFRRRGWAFAFRAGMAAGRRVGGVVPELRGGIPPIIVHGVALQLRRAADELDAGAFDLRERVLTFQEIMGRPASPEDIAGVYGRGCELVGMARGLRLAASILLDDVLGSAASDERGNGDA